MEQIIAGRFDSMAGADATAVSLTTYIDTMDICIFFNNAPGQHDARPGGGDEQSDPGAKDAPKSAAAVSATAAVVGGAIGAFGGPIVALTVAGVGAYTGSLVGALNGLEDHEDAAEHVRRPAGVFVAVHVADPKNRNRIVSTLREKGAQDIEHAQGVWRYGDWVSFDPVASPHLVTAHSP